MVFFLCLAVSPQCPDMSARADAGGADFNCVAQSSKPIVHMHNPNAVILGGSVMARHRYR